MTFGAMLFGESTLAGTLIETVPGGGEPETPPVVIVAPLTVEISGVAWRALNNSLSIERELGRQGTASFRFVNMTSIPRVGEPVRILFYTDELFVGAVDRVTIESDLSHEVTTISCECTDNSYLLFRRKVKRSFTNISLSAIASALIADELVNDGITLGTVDSFPTIPIIDADQVSAYDLLNDAAVSVGALFEIDHQKRLHFRSVSIEKAPMTVDETIAERCELTFDRETFRNEQTVIVTGTPVVESDKPNVITYTAQSRLQIPQQAVLEGTSGVYNDIQSLTHPTSNLTVDLTKLGVAYAKSLLAVRGAIRETMTVRTRQYGFRAGQFAELNITHLSRSGQWMIQKVSIRDERGQWLVTTMDLSPSTLRRRAQELWLDVVGTGKVVVLPPTAITTNQQTYSTPGVYQFVVPAGITLVQVTCSGSGGGGGGGAYHRFSLVSMVRFVSGGHAGRGGLAISVIDVTPGEVLTITVPSGGAGGLSVQKIGDTSTAIGTNGGNGGTARVARVGGSICEAYGGRQGIGGQANSITGLAATYAQNSDGSGQGQVVTAGAGSHNGTGGNGSPLVNALPGGNGSVVVEW